MRRYLYIIFFLLVVIMVFFGILFFKNNVDSNRIFNISENRERADFKFIYDDLVNLKKDIILAEELIRDIEKLKFKE